MLKRYQWECLCTNEPTHTLYLRSSASKSRSIVLSTCPVFIWICVPARPTAFLNPVHDMLFSLIRTLSRRVVASQMAIYGTEVRWSVRVVAERPESRAQVSTGACTCPVRLLPVDFCSTNRKICSRRARLETPGQTWTYFGDPASLSNLPADQGGSTQLRLSWTFVGLW